MKSAKQTITSSIVLRDVSSSTIPSEKNLKKSTQFKTFYEKKQALKYIDEQNAASAANDKNLYLFSEDKSDKSNKLFIVTTQTLIHKIVSAKQLSMYEHFEANQQVKLFIDIDLKTKDLTDKQDKNIVFESSIQMILQLVEGQLEKYNFPNKKEIIILTASTDIKMSAHIIYRNVTFNNIYDIKFFMHDIKSPLIDKNIVDLSVYKTGCFRMILCTKFGKQNPLIFSRSIDYVAPDHRQLFFDSLIQNIPTDAFIVNYQAPLNIKLKVKSKIQIIRNIITDKKNEPELNVHQNDVSLDVLKCYLDLVNVQRADKYGEWIKVGMILHNSNPRSFKLWDTWSQQSAEYDSELLNKYKWQTFSNGVGFATLKMLAKTDSPELYEKIEFSMEEPIFKSIKFESNYLFKTEKEKIKDFKSVVSTSIHEWLTSDIKTLGLKSCYNSGKTQMIKKILEEYKLKRILFVTYRQTLTNDLYGNFKDYGVLSYLDGFFESDKVICQLESLPRLLSECLFNDQIEIPSYDLVICDEMESILAHLRSVTIKEKERIFNLFMDIIYNSDKVLALDGDLGNRSYELIKECGKHIILENTIKKGDKHFVFTNDRKLFYDKIEQDLLDGKNIVIISMSSTIATEFYNKYKDKYKSILHCSNSDDKLKAELKDVNKLWSQYRLLIYSPQVESGVNHNTEHFDKMYCILCSSSCSPRALMQMTARVRQFKDTEAYVYLNGLQFKEKASFYKFDEVKAYVLDIYNNYLTPITVTDEQTKKKVIRFKYDLYTRILIHNETEEKNKHPYYFIPYLLNMLTSKGNTYKYIGSQNQKSDKEINKTQIMKEELLKTEDISNERYNVLLSNKKQNKATHEDKIQIEKHLYKINWKVKEVNEEFLNKYYRKTHVLFNLRSYLNPEKIDPYLTIDETDQHIINFDRSKKLEQIKRLKEVVQILGYNNINDGVKINKETFTKNMNQVVKESKLFTDPNISQPLFGFNKTKISSIKSFLGFINSIFKDYGFVIKSTIKKKYINKKYINIFNYEINYMSNINEYL